jgi:hypothetical protein
MGRVTHGDDEAPIDGAQISVLGGAEGLGMISNAEGRYTVQLPARAVPTCDNHGLKYESRQEDAAEERDAAHLASLEGLTLVLLDHPTRFGQAGRQRKGFQKKQIRPLPVLKETFAFLR